MTEISLKNDLTNLEKNPKFVKLQLFFVVLKQMGSFPQNATKFSLSYDLSKNTATGLSTCEILHTVCFVALRPSQQLWSWGDGQFT